MHPQQFVDDPKLCGVADTPQGWDAIQRDPDSFFRSHLLRSEEKEKQALFQFVINDLGAEISVYILYIHIAYHKILQVPIHWKSG